MRIGGKGLDTSKHAAAVTTVSVSQYRFMVPEGKRARPEVAGGAGRRYGTPLAGDCSPPGALEHRHRGKRAEIIVRHAHPRAEQPGHRPEHLVRAVAVEIEQQLEAGAREDEWRA